MAKRETILGSLLVLACFVPATIRAAERTHGGRYTEERIANARANCTRHAWAGAKRDEALQKAAEWMAIDDETLWALVPGQALPRTIDVTWDYHTTGPRTLGCLKCGDAIRTHGNYPYSPDHFAKPWKLVCPSCGAVFPTNDFGRYYASAIDRHGLFDPAKGDRTLLFNAEHPATTDPLHLFGVDDGFGYKDKTGRTHKFIGYYTWKLWQKIPFGVSALADAYIYTGDKAYARKAAILLDRIADVYPDMDWAPYAKLGWYHSDGGGGRGKVNGSIWECAFSRSLAGSYDKILPGTTDNPPLYDLLRRQAARYALPMPKGTRALLLENVDTRLLRCAAAAIMEEGRIRGNEGMHQSALVACALALDTMPETEQWLDWVFSPRGGRLPGTVLGEIDRDGVGAEAGPGYALSWGSSFANVAEPLAHYTAYAKHNVFRDLPQFRATYTAGWRMACLRLSTPNLGDSGSTGFIGIVQANPEIIARGFAHTGDPELASVAYAANGRSAKGLGRDIFAADPQAIEAQIAKIGEAAPQPLVQSRNMSGYGLAILESGSDKSGFSLYCYYGRNGGHGHHDQLNFDLLAYGMWLAPDMGYPEFASGSWAPNAWHHTAFSHNLVVVDRKDQALNWVGEPRFFATVDGISAVEIACPKAYPHVADYSRLMALVPTGAGRAYVIDIFRVDGGTHHAMTFHGPPGKCTVSGVEGITKQTTGTYAGEAIAVGAVDETSVPAYTFLYNVERKAAPPAQFMLDWEVDPGYRENPLAKGTHLRYHVAAPCDELALADSFPPRNKPGNPKTLKYMLLNREANAGKRLASTYAAVIEPYRHTPQIRSVERMPTDSDSSGAVALRIELADGTVDRILSTPHDSPAKAGKELEFSARLALIRTNKTGQTTGTTIARRRVRCNGLAMDGEPWTTGTVVRFASGNGPSQLWVRGTLGDAARLAGREIMIDNDGERNACYRIEAAERLDDGHYRLDCGRVSFVRGFADRQDYTKGYRYDFEEGAAFRIVNVAKSPGE